MRPSRGQALVEFALIMPLMVAMILLVWWLGTWYRASLAIESAAIQGTITAALTTADAACTQAEITARKVYAGTSFDSVTCQITGKDLTLTLTDTLHFNTPWGEFWSISSTQKAIVQ